MDETFELNRVRFIWNAEKAKGNVAKHGIAFERAAEAFFDPFLLVVDASPQSEARDAILGMDEHWNLLYVVHIAGEFESIRVISARRATASERKQYES